MIEGMRILGENLNATRKILKASKRMRDKDGRFGLVYKDLDGNESLLDLTEAKATADAAEARLLPYIAEAIKQRDARWVQATAVAQVAAGADFMDLCVDECTTDPEARWEHLRWLIETVAPCVDVPLTVDSSDSDAIAQALELIVSLGKPAMVNSINLEANRARLAPEIGKHKALVVANASGEKGLPKNAEERLENLDQLQALMDEAGIPMGNRYLDPLVLPIATDSENGNHFFNTARALREKYPEVHILGGYSNVSFGMPNRAILNNAYMYLAKKNGADAAIVDPMQVTQFKTDDPAFTYAVDALEGRDMFCAAYTQFCRP